MGNALHPYHVRRDSDTRFDAIAAYLGGRRGFTVFELGALDGYFSHRLAAQFDARCTAADDSKHLTETPGVTAIRERLSPTQIRALGQFDVALCLSVLHHLTNWRATLNAVRNAAPVLFVETAHPDENLPKAGNHQASPQINTALEKLGGTVLTETPGHDHRYTRPLWVIDSTSR